LVDPLEFPPTDADLRHQLDRESTEALVAELLSADGDAGRALDMANPRRVVRAVEILRLTGATPSERLRSDAAVAVRDYRSMFDLVTFGLDPGPGLNERIMLRTQLMREEGLLDEVAQLANSLGRLASLAVGYRELLDVVSGRLGVDEGFERVRRSTRALAKRQRTFFARDPRIRWFQPETNGGDAVQALVSALTEGQA
jgi:tRNA dimethylallyltransferase